MKRKITALLTAILLITVMILPSFAASELFFVSVSDTLPLALSVSQMPYYVDGNLYVPHTVFTASGLGIVPSYNGEKHVLTLFDRDRRLVFDLNAKTVKDETGKNHTDLAEKASERGGTVYLPAAACAKYFGKTVTLLTSESGCTVVRFKVGGEVYDDALFLVRAENLMQFALEQYREKLSAPAHAEENKPQQTEPAETVTDVGVYLAVTNAETMEESLAAVKQYGVSAVFYFTAEEIRSHPETVLAVAANGFKIGVTADPAATDGASALAEANGELRKLTWQKSLMALLTATQAQTVQGYYVQLRGSARTATYAAAQKTGNYLLICSEHLRGSLATLYGAKVTVLPLRETTKLK